jgi:hypothetical protein
MPTLPINDVISQDELLANLKGHELRAILWNWNK